jgi:hypothetical protein
MFLDTSTSLLYSSYPYRAYDTRDDDGNGNGKQHARRTTGGMGPKRHSACHLGLRYVAFSLSFFIVYLTKFLFVLGTTANDNDRQRRRGRMTRGNGAQTTHNMSFGPQVGCFLFFYYI